MAPVFCPASVGKPTLVAKEFGRWLTELRRGRSYEAIAGRVRDLLSPIGMKVHPSAVLKIEQGRAPSVPLLWALSRVLKVPIDEMVRRLVNDLGVDVDVPEREERASERAVALMTWFEQLPAAKQDAVIELLNVPVARRPLSAPKRTTRGPN